MEASAHPRAKLSQETLQSICTSLMNGATRTAAAARAGINRNTFYQWLDLHPHVSDAIACAEAECRARVEEKFAKDAMSGGDWRARSDWLKRRYRDDWGDKLDLTGLPDTVLLELLGANRALPTASEYPSAPQALLTVRVEATEATQPVESGEVETKQAGPGEGGSAE